MFIPSAPFLEFRGQAADGLHQKHNGVNRHQDKAHQHPAVQHTVGNAGGRHDLAANILDQDPCKIGADGHDDRDDQLHHHINDAAHLVRECVDQKIDAVMHVAAVCSRSARKYHPRKRDAHIFIRALDGKMQAVPCKHIDYGKGDGKNQCHRSNQLRDMNHDPLCCGVLFGRILRHGISSFLVLFQKCRLKAFAQAASVFLAEDQVLASMAARIVS